MIIGLDSVSAHQGESGGGFVDQLLDLVAHPAIEGTGDTHDGLGLQRLQPCGVGIHGAQVGHAIVGVQVGEVDALEATERERAQPGLGRCGEESMGSGG